MEQEPGSYHEGYKQGSRDACLYLVAVFTFGMLFLLLV